MSNESWNFETRQIHAGQTADPATGARALPIYQTTSFVFDSAQQAADRFALKELGPIYTRIGNPTQEVVENRIADLEGGVGALLVSSGQAAETLAILNIAEAGDHIVASPSLYGGTYNLLHYTLPKLGIQTTFVTDPHDAQAWKDAVQPNTKLFFAETIPNPKADILDIELVAGVAHESGVPLIVDNTVATPYLINPLKWGADIVVHSATKYLGGHGSAIGGVIVDGGSFDFAQHPERFPNYNTPDPSYNGLVFARDLGVGGAFGVNLSFILKARVQLLRDLAPRSRRSTRSSSRRASRRCRCGSSGTSRTRRRSPPGSRPVRTSGPCTTPAWSRARGTPRSRSTPRAAPVRCSRSRSRAAPRPVRRSCPRWSCTRTSPTSATSARSSSTRPRPRTASSRRRSRRCPASPPAGPARRGHRAHR